MSASSRGARTSWTARTTTATESDRCRLVRCRVRLGACRSCSCPVLAAGSGGRSGRSGPHQARSPPGTTVTEIAGEALTLTVSTVSTRLIQTWVRTRRRDRPSGKILTAIALRPDAASSKSGSGPRLSAESKSSMYQARVTRVVSRGRGVDVEASLATTAQTERPPLRHGDHGRTRPFPVGPERSDHRRRRPAASFTSSSSPDNTCRRRFRPESRASSDPGARWLKEGDQVVTFGSFFIDSEYKLKGTGPGAQARTDAVTMIIAVIRPSSAGGSSSGCSWRPASSSASTPSAPPRSTPSPTSPIPDRHLREVAAKPAAARKRKSPNR